jgi:hypothetical protein
MVRQHGAGERLNLRQPCGFPPQRVPSHACGFDAAANRSKTHIQPLKLGVILHQFSTLRK